MHASPQETPRVISISPSATTIAATTTIASTVKTVMGVGTTVVVVMVVRVKAAIIGPPATARSLAARKCDNDDEKDHKRGDEDGFHGCVKHGWQSGIVEKPHDGLWKSCEPFRQFPSKAVMRSSVP